MVRLPPASRIDRFEIKSLIGSGGMGTLYLARDTSPNTYRLVALKLLNTNLDSEDLRDRFGREARALASLSHPNVVNIHECGEYRGSPYIVMEYVRGETLAEKIKRRAPLSLSDKLKLMMELCAGLAHAHEAGIIHRDIKPANLMVDHHGRLRLLDFGIARVVEAGVTMVGVQMTQINMRIGTPGYMSPEQYEGAEIDRRSDIFAVGAVFYELLAYREAFPGSTTRQIEKRVLESEPERLTSQIPDLDPEIEAVVAKALQKDPDKRFQDAAQMERALTKVWWRLGLAESVSSAPRPTPVPMMAAGKKSSRADAAYQRALAALDEGAPEAARRYAMEALAEDSKHEGARRFLQQHDPNFKLPPPSPPPPPPPSDEILEPTIVSSRTELNFPDFNQEVEQTLVSVPGRRRTPVSSKQAPRPSGSQKKPKKRPNVLAGVWSSYGFAISAVGLALVVGGAVLVAVLMRDWSQEGEGHLLTVTRPANGTIVGDGINCGTGGSDCSESIEPESAVALRLVPDEGYAAGAFTDNCGPLGRFRMSAPQTCGATFVRVPDAITPGGTTPGAAGKHTLTILAIEGGVVRVGDVDCRATRGGCSVPLPAGTRVDLEAQADRGYTFEMFTGDCDLDGRVVMDGPHTCGARFVPNAGTRAPNPPGPPPSAPSGRPTPGTVATSKPSTGTTNTGSGTRGAPGGGAAPGGGGAGAADAPGGGGAGASASAGAGGAALPQLPPPPPSVGKDDTSGSLVPPAPPAPVPPAELAKSEIGDVLERYRKAYIARDFNALRQVWPSAHENVGKMLRDLTEVRFEFVGEPKLELQLPQGTGTAVLTTKITEFKGRAKSQRDTIATIKLSKVNNANRWVILSVFHKQAD
jgi:serine/threonine protein kinase